MVVQIPVCKAQNEQLELRQVSYLTPNIDSTLKAFLALSFSFDLSPYHPFGPFIARLRAPEFVSVSSSDLSDSSLAATREITRYGHHVSSITFATRDLPALERRLADASIPFRSDVSNQIAIVGTAPLKITFEILDSTNSGNSASKFGRISWLVFTASDSVQIKLRKLFRTLDLQQIHEGCCDYWLLGPIERRTAIRFELPPDSPWANPPPKRHPEANWLSIEEGGIIYAY